MSKRVPEKKPSSVRGIVLALVLATLGLGGGYVWGVRSAEAKAVTPAEGETAQVEAFIRNYFNTWSNQDLAGYGACFHPGARIWYVPPGGRTESLALAPFLDTQKAAHANSPVRMKEYPLEMKIELRNGLANVWVYWELAEGEKLTRGYDFYTLVQVGGQWRILSLVFNTEPGK